MSQVTEDNFHSLFWRYVTTTYNQQIYNYHNACPYDLDFDDEKLIHIQVMTWYMFERKDEYGKTIVDEFVDMFVDDQRLRAKILQAKNLFYDDFIIQRSADEHGIIQARSKTSNKVFQIEARDNYENFAKWVEFSGFIYPWHDDGTHQMTGIITMDYQLHNKLAALSPATIEKKLQDEMESEVVTIKSRLPTLLKRMPANWINGISVTLDIVNADVKKAKIKAIINKLTSEGSLTDIISGLPEDEKVAFQFVLKKGGFVKYADFCRRTESDDTVRLWDKKHSSIVTNLRRLGLIIVGKMMMNNRRYKVAIIPADIVHTVHTTKAIQNILKTINVEKYTPNTFRIVPNHDGVM